jgi:hypothetical protein
MAMQGAMLGKSDNCMCVERLELCKLCVDKRDSAFNVCESGRQILG